MKFTSPELQKAFDTAKPILEKITETKNRISSEIKNLEIFFQSLDINETVSYQATNPNHQSSVILDQFCDESLNGTGVSIEELLIWDHTKKRIIYIKNKYQATLNLYDEFNPVSLDTNTLQNIYNKPLVETPFDIRKEVYKNHLSKFLYYIAEKYQPPEESTESDSSN